MAKATFTDRIDPELLEGLSTFAELTIPTNEHELAAFRDQLADTAEQPADGTRDGVARQSITIRTSAGPLTLLVYRPENTHGLALPGIVWAHGGGLIAGSAYGEDDGCRRLSASVGAVVASADYRLAPDFPYPAALDDVYAALVWLSANSVDFGVDQNRLAVGGGSAGGGLAALLALTARDRGGPKVVFQYLRYPMLDDRGVTSSAIEFADIPSWSGENNAYAWECFRGAGRDGEVAEAPWSPSRYTDLAGLPPTLIQVGELDVFRDESIAYASRLMEAGVPTDLNVYSGAYHGFDGAAPAARVTIGMTHQMEEAFKRAFAGPIDNRR